MAKETKTKSSTDNAAGTQEAKKAEKAEVEEASVSPAPSESASHPSPETLTALQEELSRGLDARRVVLVAAPAAGDNTYVAAVQLDRQLKGDDRVTLGQRLVTRGAAAGYTILPAFYSDKEWQALDEVTERPRWLGCLGGGDGQQPSLVETLRQRDPSQLRYLLMKSIRNHLAFFDFIQRSALFPRHLGLTFCAAVMQESLELLFATKGATFTGDAAAVRFFDEQIAGGGHFERGDVQLYFQLKGLAEQAKHYHQLKAAREPPFGWMAEVKRTCRFLEAFDRYVRDNLTSPKERRRLRRRRFLLAGGVALVLMAAVAFYVIITWPQGSNIDETLITSPGGIVGQYYNGTNFNKKVLKRTDDAINLVTGAAPAKGVTADRFSVRWEGFIYFSSTGETQLCAESDDGVRVFFNNALLIDDWSIHAMKKACELVRVQKGWYPLKVDFFDEKSGARMRLLMGETPDEARLVPPKQLCCRGKSKK
jgi:PA14 domain